MAGENKEIELLNELIRATEEGRVTWRPTARVNEFTASFRGHFSVLVSKGENDVCHLRIVDEDDRELLHTSDDYILMQTVSSLGLGARAGQTLVGALTGVPPKPVSRLFDLARRGGLKVDQAIDEILQGLKSA